MRRRQLGDIKERVHKLLEKNFPRVSFVPLLPLATNKVVEVLARFRRGVQGSVEELGVIAAGGRLACEASVAKPCQWFRGLYDDRYAQYQNHDKRHDYLGSGCLPLLSTGFSAGRRRAAHDLEMNVRRRAVGSRPHVRVGR